MSSANNVARNTFDTFGRSLIKLSYIFLAKQEISEAYTNVPAKTLVNYFISMTEFFPSVAQFCVRLHEHNIIVASFSTIKASDMRFAAKCRH